MTIEHRNRTSRYIFTSEQVDGVKGWMGSDPIRRSYVLEKIWSEETILYYDSYHTLSKKQLQTVIGFKRSNQFLLGNGQTAILYVPVSSNLWSEIRTFLNNRETNFMTS